MPNFTLNPGLRPLTISFLIGIVCVLPAFSQVSASLCGPLTNAYGPYDYRADHHVQAPGDQMPHSEKRQLVELWHFTPRVENLIGAQSSGQIGPPGADLDYTLRAFPNNHRALMSVMRYGEKTGRQQPPGLRYVVECYFERALRFRPNDTVARIIYSTYLSKNKRATEAITQLEQATRFAGNNAFSHFNIGLAYFDMKIYDKALSQAHRALELGFERTQLRDMLEKAGQWKEPTSASASNLHETAVSDPSPAVTLVAPPAEAPASLPNAAQ